MQPRVQAGALDMVLVRPEHVHVTQATRGWLARYQVRAIVGLVVLSRASTRFCDVPAGWSCEEQHYASGDGCDCGCTEWDPDCAPVWNERVQCQAAERIRFFTEIPFVYNDVCLDCPVDTPRYYGSKFGQDFRGIA